MAKNLIIGSGWAGKQYTANILRDYRLNRADYLKIWAEQGGRCAGCEEAFAHPFDKVLTTGTKPEVDHSHKTGRVRGLLCRRCNDFLGKVQDNHETLARLTSYLRKHGEEI